VSCGLRAVLDGGLGLKADFGQDCSHDFLGIVANVTDLLIAVTS